MARKKRKLPSGKWMGIVVVGFVALFFSFVGYLVLLDSSQTEPDVDVQDAPNVKNRPGGESTPEYVRKLSRHNTEQAELAEEQGRNFLPTIVGRGSEKDLILDDGEAEKQDKPEEKPQKVDSQNEEEDNQDRYRIRPRNNRNTGADKEQARLKQERLEQYREAVANQMQDIYEKTSVKPVAHSTSIYQGSSPDSKNNEQDGMTRRVGSGLEKSRKDDRTVSSKKEEDSISEFSPGDVLYAVNDMQLSSDSPSPVKATVISGEYKDSDLIGEFTRERKNLVLKFNVLIEPDGTEHRLNAVAIDPEVPKYAIRSRVDSHMFQRWGGLIATSFLEGFGEAVGQSGQTTVVTDHGTQTGHPEYDTKDETWIAASRVSGRLADKMDQNFDRPPTVYLDPGQPLGVLVLESN